MHRISRKLKLCIGELKTPCILLISTKFGGIFKVILLFGSESGITFSSQSNIPVKLLDSNCGNTREWSGTLPYHWVEAIEKGAFRSPSTSVSQIELNNIPITLFPLH